MHWLVHKGPTNAFEQSLNHPKVVCCSPPNPFKKQETQRNQVCVLWIIFPPLAVFNGFLLIVKPCLKE